MEDYYDTLGLDKSASVEGVKKAYRRLARKYHPDVNKAPDAEERFKKINEAYQILSDPKKKQAYDKYGKAAFSGAGFGQGPFAGNAWGQSGQRGPFTYTYSSSGQNPGGDFGGINLEDLFGGGDSVFESFFGGGLRRKGKDLRYSLKIEFADAVRGMESEISVDGRKIKVKIPPGVITGSEIRFSGKGGEGPVVQGKAAPAGDLYLHIHIDERTLPDFELIGSDVLIRKTITFPQAALGDNVEVSVVDSSSSRGFSKIKVKIPAGTQSGTQLRLKSKGMPLLRTKGFGDAYVKILVKVPEKLGRKEKELVQELDSLLR